MNRKLERLLEEIRKTERKIEEWQNHLAALNKRKKQIEDEEIVRSIRSMKLQSRELLELLAGMQEGTVSIQYGGCESDPVQTAIDRETDGVEQKNLV